MTSSRNAYILSTIVAAAALLSGCNGSQIDPDTQPTSQNTMRINNFDITMVDDRKGPLSNPTYLPNWAPDYPGATVMSKSVERRGDKVFSRGTVFRTVAPLEDVKVFYRDYYRKHNLHPLIANSGTIRAFRGFEVPQQPAVKFIFPRSGRENILIVREQPGNGSGGYRTISVSHGSSK